MNEDFLHGGALDIIAQRYPDAPMPWIDLSTGINPWSWPVEKCQPVSLAHLPTKSEYQNCVQALSSYLNAPSEHILLAPGSELLIRLLPTILNPQKVVIHSPIYGDHINTWTTAKCEIIETKSPLTYADSADCIVICNPNNPDGHAYSREELDEALNKLSAHNGYLIIDEAYADLYPDLSLADCAGRKGLIILRSIGKFFGLAGLRLGAILAEPEILKAMQDRLGVWSVSTQALHIGAAAYRDFKWHEETRSRLKSEIQKLDQILNSNSITQITGTNLYRFINIENAHKAWDVLISKGIYTRRFDWTNNHLRIGLPTNADASNRLAQALSLLR
ncbi:threonine-phosphate decarboxylase CobD [Hirschia baltica]|uniref:threonine-phosphate decarboxylase n=1 Tax=Hirschia baltica (strain ATCC 49814 / DSM 5838 / IFAM 1418) TaxID=582402 RepID=C6XM10_HIRBI|nr:threonine-phosphate decarboxylase CobD [Hirschia baltica]ACT59842.1 L-threonine-O-3-phosphate decarboxylase [Hirschia baltica ATCC 49814]